MTYLDEYGFCYNILSNIYRWLMYSTSMPSLIPIAVGRYISILKKESQAETIITIR